MPTMSEMLDSDTDEHEAAPLRPRRWWPRLALAALAGACLATGWWQTTKPLIPGAHVESEWLAVPASDIALLADVTAADAYGRPVIHQQIFDETLRMIAAAREFIVLDMFLFNDHHGAMPTQDGQTRDSQPLRPLSRELRDALISAKRQHPQLRVLLITDPVNDVYGGDPSPDLAMLSTAGVDVVRMDLDRLRDSNPAYSALWRLGIRWWSGNGSGKGWLPNPLDHGPSEVTFRAWARLLNFKADHRKVLIADDGHKGLVGIVASANAHDASSAHSNLGLAVRGFALLPLLRSELDIARHSGWRGELPISLVAPAPRAVAAADLGNTAFVRVLTEGGINDAVLEQIRATRAGDRIDTAMFYLSDRDVIEALLEAAARGVEVRVLLDPNSDAFGYRKSGIPNRPVAAELLAQSDGAIGLRWYRTHGEQFHVKMLAVRTPDKLWFTVGSANLTRRNLEDYNLEANLAVELPQAAPLSADLGRWFDTLWENRAPPGIEYTTDFGTYADPAQTHYWAYRFMEATGLSTF